MSVVSSKIAKMPLPTGSPPTLPSPPSSAPALATSLNVVSSAPKAKASTLAAKTPICKVRIARAASGCPQAPTVSMPMRARKRRKRRKKRLAKDIPSIEGERRTNLRRHDNRSEMGMREMRRDTGIPSGGRDQDFSGFHFLVGYGCEAMISRDYEMSGRRESEL